MSQGTLDFDALRRRTLGDARIMDELLDLFRSTASAGLNAFRAAVLAGDHEHACRAAHRMKGSAATIAAPALAALLARAEAHCSADETDAVFTMLPEIDEAFSRCVAAIDEYRSRQQAG